jgi:hypothetical protein
MRYIYLDTVTVHTGSILTIDVLYIAAGDDSTIDLFMKSGRYGAIEVPGIYTIGVQLTAHGIAENYLYLQEKPGVYTKNRKVKAQALSSPNFQWTKLPPQTLLTVFILVCW